MFAAEGKNEEVKWITKDKEKKEPAYFDAEACIKLLESASWNIDVAEAAGQAAYAEASRSRLREVLDNKVLSSVEAERLLELANGDIRLALEMHWDQHAALQKL